MELVCYKIPGHLLTANLQSQILHTWNLAIPFVSHVSSADAAVLPQNSGVGANVTTLQEGNVGLTHRDVLWCGVGVQLLMPSLQEMAFNAL